jgi:4-amino-4-deoxy-L-arabinose transferase-like glycosyltransferase
MVASRDDVAHHGVDRTFRASDIALLAAVSALAAGLRAYRLDGGLWFDEIVTLLHSVRPALLDVVTHFPSNNDHPLYSVLAHLSVQAFGERPWAMRLPAALLGVATVPMLYVLGRWVTSRAEAWAATLVLAVSYHHVWFSQNARGYTALLFCVLLSTYALLRWFDDSRRAWLVVFAVATAVGAYAHLTMVLVCLSQALVCVADWGVRGAGSRVHTERVALATGFVGSGVLTVLCYAPMLADVSRFFTTQTATSTEVATPVWALVAAAQGLLVGFGTAWVVAGGLIVFCAGIASYAGQRALVALLFLVPLPFTVLVALAMNRPIFPRFVFFAVGFLLLVTVRGAGTLGALASRLTGLARQERARVVAVAVLAVAGVAVSLRSLPYGYRYPKQDYGGAVALVDRELADGDRVAALGDTGAIPVIEFLERPWTRVDDAAGLQRLRDGAGRVWVIYSFPSYLEAGQPDLWATLRDECAEVGEFEGTVAGGTVAVRRCP